MPPPAELEQTPAWGRYAAGELRWQFIPASVTRDCLARCTPQLRGDNVWKDFHSMLCQAQVLASQAPGGSVSSEAQVLCPRPLPCPVDLDEPLLALLLESATAKVVAVATFWTSLRLRVGQVALVAEAGHVGAGGVLLHLLLEHLDEKEVTFWARVPPTAAASFAALHFVPRRRLALPAGISQLWEAGPAGALMVRPCGGASVPRPSLPAPPPLPSLARASAPSSRVSKRAGRGPARAPKELLPRACRDNFETGAPANWSAVAPGVVFCSMLTENGIVADGQMRSKLVEIKKITDPRHPVFKQGGHGVFLTADVKKDEIIMIYSGKLVSADIPSSSDYVVGLDSLRDGNGASLDIDASEYGSEARFINHAGRSGGKTAGRIPNCTKHNCILVEYRAACTGAPVIVVEAICSIPAGTELTIDYGGEYWARYKQRMLEDEAVAEAAAAADEEEEEEEEAMAPVSDSPHPAALLSPGTSPSSSPAPEAAEAAEAAEPARKRQRVVEPPCAAAVALPTPHSRCAPLPSLLPELPEVGTSLAVSGGLSLRAEQPAGAAGPDAAPVPSALETAMRTNLRVILEQAFAAGTLKMPKEVLKAKLVEMTGRGRLGDIDGFIGSELRLFLGAKQAEAAAAAAAAAAQPPPAPPPAPPPPPPAVQPAPAAAHEVVDLTQDDDEVITID